MAKSPNTPKRPKSAPDNYRYGKRSPEKRAGIMEARELTMRPRLQAFVDALFADAKFNPAVASKMVGYTGGPGQALNLMKRRDVQEMIATREAENRERFDITEEKIMQELAKIGFTSTGDVMLIGFTEDGDLDLKKLTKAQRAAIQSMKVKTRKERVWDEEANDYVTVPVREVDIKFHGKTEALVQMGKHIGMFKEKVEITGDEDIIAALTAGRRRMAGEAKIEIPTEETKH